MSAFQKIINYVNTNNIGDVIARSNILKVSKESSDAYIDTIRLKLTTTGFLKTTQRSGRYKFIKKVPTNISSSDLDRAYYLANHRLPYTAVVGKILDNFIAKNKPADDADEKKLKDFAEAKGYVDQMRDHRNVYEILYLLKPKRFKHNDSRKNNFLLWKLMDDIQNYDQYLIKNKRK